MVETTATSISSAVLQPAESPPVTAYDLRHGAACALVSLLIGLSQGFGIYLVNSNLTSIQGSLGATSAEAGWLMTAYFGSALSATVLLTKFRLHFGLRPFALVGLVGFLVVSAFHLTTDSLASAIAARAALGVAAAPLSALTIYYMMEALPKPHAAIGLLAGLCVLQLPLPLSRVISPHLLEVGRWHGLFLIDVALAVLSIAAIHAVSLAPMPMRSAFSRGDLPAFVCYAAGMALLCVVVSQGRVYWWTDARWLGVCLALALAFLAGYVLIDLGRESPLLDLRWLCTPYMLRFIFSVLVFRIILSEQNVGIVGLMNALGQNNEQMRTMFLLVSAGTVAGFAIAIIATVFEGVYLLGIAAALIVAICALADANVTSLTRPGNLYLTQTFLAAALAIFFAGSGFLGFIPVVKDGSKNIVSFLAAFTGSQYLGSLLGSAWLSTAVIDRQQVHFAALAQHLSIGDPTVGARIGQLAASITRFLPDSSERANQGLALFSQQVRREAIVLAYHDVFLSISGTAAAVALWMTWIRWAAKRRMAQAAQVVVPVDPALAQPGTSRE